MMNSITPYEARYQQKDTMTSIMNILSITFFFAYMGYTLLMEHAKSQNKLDERMKAMEAHLKTFEENASFIMNELVNSTDEVTELQKEVDVLTKKLLVMYKYAHEFDNDWHSEKWRESFEHDMKDVE